MSSTPKKRARSPSRYDSAARVALAGDDERVEVAAGLEAVAVAQGRLDEGEVEADRVADEDRVAGEVDEGLGGLLRRSARP